MLTQFQLKFKACFYFAGSKIMSASGDPCKSQIHLKPSNIFHFPFTTKKSP